MKRVAKGGKEKWAIINKTGECCANYKLAKGVKLLSHTNIIVLR